MFYTCDMAHWYGCVTWLMNMCVWHDSLMCMCDITHWYVCVTWLIEYACDMTHSCVCVTSFIDMRVSHDSLIRECDMAHSYLCVTWLIEYVCDMTHWSMCMTWLIDICDLTWLFDMCVWHDSFICVCDMTHSHSHKIVWNQTQIPKKNAPPASKSVCPTKLVDHSNVLQVCGRVLQYVAVCCSMLFCSHSYVWLQHTAATHCCNTLLQHPAATPCCNT